MASLRLPATGGKWTIRYRDASGRLREKTTPYGKHEKRAAQKYMADFMAQQSRVRDGLERAVERMTLAELWQRYEPVGRQKRSWKSIEGRWKKHINPILGGRQIHAIEPADIETLMAKKMAAGLSPQTAEHLRVLLSSMYTYAIKKLRVMRSENPARIADKPSIPPPRIRFLDPISLEMLLTAVPPKWAGIFAVSAYTGMRKGEVLGLRLGDVDLGRMVIWVWRSYDKNTTKGGKGRRIGFPPVLIPHLRAAMARAVELNSEWLFPDRRGEVRGPDTKLTNVLRRAMAQAGITAPSGFSYKDLRSTFATHLAEATGDLRVVQKQLGHSSPALTDKHYAFARDRHLVEQVARLPYGPNRDSQGHPGEAGNITPMLSHSHPTNVADPDQTQPSPTEVS